MLGFGASEMIIVLAILSGGGLGVPLGMPPLPEDPVLARVAPAECLWYLSWAGTAKPDPKSANATEQLLAERQIQELFQQIDAALTNSLAKSAGDSADNKIIAAEAPKLLRTLLMRPAAVYLASFGVGENRPEVDAALIVNLGEAGAPAIKETEASIKKLQEIAFRGQKVEQIKGNNATWNKLPLPPQVPPVVWGVKGRYLIVCIGDSSPDKITERGAGSPPAWYTELRKQNPVERVSLVSYMNFADIVASIPEANQAQVAPFLEALGLSQVRSLSNVSGLDKTGVVSRSLLVASGEPKGVLTLLSGDPLTADDLKSLPKDAAIAMAARLDLGQAFTEFQSVMKQIEPRAADEMERGITQMQAMLGFDLREDLFGGLGNVWQLYSSPSDGSLLFNGATLVASVNDKAKLEKVQKIVIAMTAATGMREDGFGRRRGVSIKEKQVGSETMHFFNFVGDVAPVAPAWCLTKDELIVALYPQAVEAHLARANANSSLAELPQVAAALKTQPVTVSYQDTATLFRTFYPMTQAFLQMMFAQAQHQGVELDISMLPPADVIAKHLSPSITTVTRTKEGIRTESHRSMPSGGGFTSVAPIGTALLLPAVQASRAAARRAQSSNNLKQIGLAMHNFHDTFGSMPSPTVTSQGGKLSWRVQILPFIEEMALYNQFKLDEPWDSEHNKKLIPLMPAVFRSPSSKLDPAEGLTNYLTVRGDAMAFPEGEKGISFADVTDGTSNTIMTLEADDDRAVIWTKPDDFEVDEENPLAGLGNLMPGGFNVGFMDGSVRFISSSIDPSLLRALFTRNGGEVVGGQFNIADPVTTGPQAELQTVP